MIVFGARAWWACLHLTSTYCGNGRNPLSHLLGTVKPSPWIKSRKFKTLSFVSQLRCYTYINYKSCDVSAKWVRSVIVIIWRDIRPVVFTGICLSNSIIASTQPKRHRVRHGRDKSITIIGASFWHSLSRQQLLRFSADLSAAVARDVRKSADDLYGAYVMLAFEIHAKVFGNFIGGNKDNTIIVKLSSGYDESSRIFFFFFYSTSINNWKSDFMRT